MEIELELNKRYICQNGNITEPLTKATPHLISHLDKVFLFMDPGSGVTYDLNGYSTILKSVKQAEDIVKEYKEYPDLRLKAEKNPVWS